MQRQVPDMIVQEGGAYHFIRKNDILYIEKNTSNARLVTAQGKLVISNIPFEDIKAHPLFSENFMHVHRWLINKNHVKEISNKDKEIKINLSNDTVLRCNERESIPWNNSAGSYNREI